MSKHVFDYYSVSYKGRRDSNQDRVYINIYKNKQNTQLILAVADGMGGYEYGEVAAQIMINYLKKLCRQNIPLNYESAAKITRDYIQEANTHIFALSKKYGGIQMGTTVAGALLIKNFCLFFNVGDSRIYTLKSEEIRQISHDHSEDMEAFEKGLIKEEEIGKGLYGNALTRSIGTDKEVEIDIFPQDNFKTLQEGEIIFACTDGLWNVANKNEIYREIIGRCNLKESLESLAYLAYENEGNDNISMAAFEFGKLSRNHLNLEKYSPLVKDKENVPRKKIVLRTLIIVFIIAFMVVVMIIVYQVTIGGSYLKIQNRRDNTNLQLPQIQGEDKTNTTFNKKDIQGGEITFDIPGRTSNKPLTIRLTAQPLAVRGEQVPSDIFYSLDGSEPTKEKGIKFENSDAIVLKDFKNYILKAKVFSKVGKYESKIYSQSYNITPLKEKHWYPTISKFRQLDRGSRMNIFQNTRNIDIDLQGIQKIKPIKNGKIEMRIFISSDGDAKVITISGLDVMPREKLIGVKSALIKKINAIKFAPPITNGSRKNVNVKLWINFEKVDKNENKIVFQRED